MPPELAFVIAHAASLRVLNSALDCRGKHGVRNCGVVGQAHLDVYQDWENVGVNDGLDLLSVARGDV